MSELNVEKVRKHLEDFNFHQLFIEELGWQNPATKNLVQIEAGGKTFQYKGIALLGGIEVFEVTSPDGKIPDRKTQAQVANAVSKHRLENVLIFLDEDRSQSVWYWIKREGKKSYPRDHYFFKGQAADPFISKIASMSVDLSELDEEGNIDLLAASKKVTKALDSQRLIKKFYTGFQDRKDKFVLAIEGIPDPNDRGWYASVLLNRLMFIYFLQKGMFLDGGNVDYLDEKLKEHGDEFYSIFLQKLFFEAFALSDPSKQTRELCGDIPYLNGGLFIPHRLEVKYEGKIKIPTSAFEEVLELFGDFRWTFNDVPGDPEKEINPDVLGYIFEKYINQKEFGAYYTPTEITDYLCHQTIEQLVLDKMADRGFKGHESLGDLLLRLDAKGTYYLLNDVLPSISLLDPACGSGAFLYAALRSMMSIYGAAIGRISVFNDEALNRWKANEFESHRSQNYWLKKKIITDNLYGVDIMEEATEIAKLRLFMALVGSAKPGDELEPLPNIDFNILPGNSLIGLMRVEDEAFDNSNRQQQSLYTAATGYAELVAQKAVWTGRYKRPRAEDDITQIRDEIDNLDKEAIPILDEMLLEAFHDQKVKFEQAHWDTEKQKVGKPSKRPLTRSDIDELTPFHWGYQFHQRFSKGKGFDAIITNPPWEILKPQDKEFFQQVGIKAPKNNMTIKEFQALRKQVLSDRPELVTEYEEYLSGFPHQSAYFRSAPEYDDQSAIVNGKKTGTDINLYKLFVERCFDLLRPGGLCGIVIPGSIYTDLGSTGLRRMLFSSSIVTGCIGLSNEKFIFEGVHHAYKICLFSFRKGGKTKNISASFRIDPREAISKEHLEAFLSIRDNRILIDLKLIKKLAPQTLSLLEFKCPQDIEIAKKMAEYPRLDEYIEGSWNLRLGSEFHMTNDSHLFVTAQSEGTLPLFEGKMIHQFSCKLTPPRYWVKESDGRSKITGRADDDGRELDYQRYRLCYRSVSGSSNLRTMIATVLPKNVFCGHSLNCSKITGDYNYSETELLFLAGLFNSLVVDYAVRRSVTTNLTLGFIYQLAVPRIQSDETKLMEIVLRVAKLVCTDRRFDELAVIVGLSTSDESIIEPRMRQVLQVEIDARVASLFNLTEGEFAHILSTFPLVAQEIRDATLDEFRKLPPSPSAHAEGTAETIREIIDIDECDDVEFKGSLFTALEFEHDKWKSMGLEKSVIQKKLRDEEKAVTHSALKTICAFINTDGGDLLLGVKDETREILGLEPDFKRDKKKPNADGFELTFRQLIDKRIEPTPHGLVKIGFAEFDGRTVCHVKITPSTDPHHLDKEEVFIRDGNRTIQLKGVELTNWLKKRVGR